MFKMVMFSWETLIFLDQRTVEVTFYLTHKSSFCAMHLTIVSATDFWNLVIPSESETDDIVANIS